MPTQHTKWSRTVVLGFGAAIAVLVLVLAFVWPSLTSTVKDIPLAVSGTSAEVKQVSTALDTQADGAFTITRVSSRSAAVKLIKTRDVDGAILLGTSPEVLTASADAVAVSQILGGVATGLQAKANAAAAQGVAVAIAAGTAPAGTVAPTITVTVTDVVPLASTDARGIGLTTAAFPLVLGGIIGGVLISLLVVGVWRRLSTVAIYAIVAGFGVVSIMQGWFGVLQGNYLVNVGAVALAMSGTAAFVVGMNALIGSPGIAVGSVITMLIGNPLSSAAQPVQFIVAPWGQVGQWFVPGASATLLRDLSYFPEANPSFAWLVLAGWSALGVILMIAGHFRNQEVVHVKDALEPAHVAAHTHPAHAAV